MTPLRALRPRALAGLFTLALVVRLAVLVSLRDAPFARVLLGDAEGFVAWGREIAAGDWFGHEVFYQAPLYPYFLGVLFALGGGVLAVKVVQALLGALACVAIASAAALLFDRRPADDAGLGRVGGAGILAGVFAALYGPSIWLEGLIHKTALATFFGSLLVWLLAREVARARDGAPESRGRMSTGSALGIGLTLGLLALLRENSLVLLFPLLGWFAVARDRRRVLPAFLLGLALLLAPVGWRNASLGGAFLPTASNAGVNFYIGNSSDADGLYRPLIAGRGHARFESDDAHAIAERIEGRELSPAGVSSFWLRRAVDEIREQGLRWPKLLLWKTLLVSNRMEIMDAESFESARSASFLLALLGFLGHFGFLLPLAVAGWWFSRRDGVGLFALCALLLAASIALFFVTARFRIALVPWLMPFAARGALGLVRGLRDPWIRRRSRPAILLAAGAALVANAPIHAFSSALFGIELAGDPIGTTWTNIASARLRAGDDEGAYRAAAAAIGRDPNDANALFNLAQAASGLGRTDEALAAFAEAERLEPAFAPDCELQLGRLLAISGNLPAALEHFERAVVLAPDSGLAHYSLGLALRQSGRDAEAEAAYRESIRLDPSFPDAHHNLGFLLERRGDRAGAIEQYRAALAADPQFELSRERLRQLGIAE